jgi:hypothetical protein
VTTALVLELPRIHPRERCGKLSSRCIVVCYGAVPHVSLVAFFSLCLEGEMHMIFSWSALRNIYSLHS